MKDLNEIKRFQKIAGIENITENNEKFTNQDGSRFKQQILNMTHAQLKDLKSVKGTYNRKPGTFKNFTWNRGRVIADFVEDSNKIVTQARPIDLDNVQLFPKI